MKLYDNNATYHAGDRVYYGNYVYEAIAETTGNLPIDNNYWTMKWMFASDLMIQSYQNRVKQWHKDKKEREEKNDEDLALTIVKVFLNTVIQESI